MSKTSWIWQSGKAKLIGLSKVFTWQTVELDKLVCSHHRSLELIVLNQANSTWIQVESRYTSEGIQSFLIQSTTSMSTIQPRKCSCTTVHTHGDLKRRKVHPRHTSWNWKACKWRLQVVFEPLDRNVLCRRLLNTCFNWKSNSSFESFTSLSYWMTARLWALSKVSVNGGTKGKIQWRMNTKWSTRSLFSPPEGGSPYETANSTNQQKLGSRT